MCVCTKATQINRGQEDGSAGEVLLHRHEDLSSDLWHPHRKLAWRCVSVTSELGMQRLGGEGFCEEEFRGSLGKFLRPYLKRKNTVVAGGWDSSVIESFLSRHEAWVQILRGEKSVCIE